MTPEPSTWGQVGPGDVVQAADLKHYLITQEATVDGVRWVQLMGANRQYQSVHRRPDGEPIVKMVTTEPEAILLLGDVLGAQVLWRSNQDTLPLRAMRFRVDPLPARGKGAAERIKSHIDMTHGVYVGDGSTNRSVKEWHEMHDEMHAAETATMVIPHHHEEET